MDPKASRETLDHSIMYIFAVALKMVIGIILNLIHQKEPIEKVQLNFGKKLNI